MTLKREKNTVPEARWQCSFTEESLLITHVLTTVIVLLHESRCVLLGKAGSKIVEEVQE